MTRLASMLLLAWYCAGLLLATTIAQSPPAEASATPIDALLEARKNVENFFDQSSNVVCAENITQIVIGKNGKPAYREESAYEYQLQASARTGTLKLSETRETRKKAFRDPRRSLLITNGFASMLLIAHPSYESSYQFEAGGEESADGITFAKINFKSVPGASSPAALQLRGKNYPMPLSGTLWIDKRSGAITKLRAAVDSTMEDMGLQGMRSEIHYAVVQFHDPEEKYWMPVSATIDVETPRQHWRNVHRFTNYRRFRGTLEVEFGSKP